MRRPSSSLGLKINLALLIFLLVLGGATARIILYGFERTQDNATEASRQGLEESGRATALSEVRFNSNIGVLQMQWAADAGHLAAGLIRSARELGTQTPFDVSKLTRTESGILYDPDPGRISDTAMPNFAPLTPDAIQDVKDMAVLDTIFPSLLSSYPGRIRDPGFDGVAVFFTSVNQVTRYYPAIGLHLIARPDTDLSPRLRELGPELNPERKTVWTAPYQDNAGQGLVLTAYTPVYDGGVYRGIIGVDLSLGRLVDEVNLVQPTPGSNAFYVDRDGNLLPSKSYKLINDALGGPEGKPLSAVMDAMRRGESDVARIMLGGRESFVAYAPLNGIGGSFAIAVPIDELTAQADAITAEIETEGNRTLMLTLVEMGVIFIAGLILAKWLSRRMLLKPIESLVEGTRAVAAGKLNTRLALTGDDEMTTLARSFNQMTDEIRQRSQALEREVAERRQAQDELRALFAVMTDYVLVVDKDGRYLRMQKTNTPDILGAPEDLVGKTMDQVMSAGQAETFMAPIREALAANETRHVEYPLDIDGRIYWYSTAISPMSAETVLIVARDITERVLARQELERRVEERTRELEGILDISKNLASTLDLRTLLKTLLDQLKPIADYHRSSIFLLEGDEMVMLDARQETGTSAPISFSLALDLFRPDWDKFKVGEPRIIDDVRDDSEEAAGWKAATGEYYDTAFRFIHSWMAVPLALKDRLLGMITVSHEQPGYYHQHHAQLVQAIANQAAVAIENARLYGQAQQLAAVEERQKLARDLHDSVSQALYGIALGARTARTLLDRDAAKATDPVDYVLSLAEAGLAEMRALIFELRPESLEIEGLVAALDKQIAATAARYHVSVESDLCEEPALPLNEKEVFYRVGQEALHNVIKHSKATQAKVRLEALNGDVSLEVQDNGVGFDAGASFPGHMGLVSMAERAASIGASFEVESEPGRGTTIRVSHHRV
jgi:PAS domain S-box-containing protein